MDYYFENGIYFLTCKQCSDVIGRRRISHQVKKDGFRCDRCKRENSRKTKEKLIEKEVLAQENRIELEDLYKYTKEEARFEKAIKSLEKQNINIKSYQDSIDIIHMHIHKTGWFNSTEEIMTAIELHHRGYKIRHQQKIGKYKVDFLILDKKTIIEVDGGIYHSDKSREAERDFYIHKVLGFDWKILHINTEHINKKIRLLSKAIESSELIFAK